MRDLLLALGARVERRRHHQPEGLWDVPSGGQYIPSKGPGLYRRSLYTFWKRTVPHLAMVIFDAADRSNCAARRQSTSTPLQALALLNDPQFVEASRQLSQLMLKEGGPDDRARASWMSRRVLGRPASRREADVLVRLLVEQRDLFSTDRESAAKLIAVGESRHDPALDLVELAAGAVLAQAILDHDGAVFRH